MSIYIYICVVHFYPDNPLFNIPMALTQMLPEWVSLILIRILSIYICIVNPYPGNSLFLFLMVLTQILPVWVSLALLKIHKLLNLLLILFLKFHSVSFMGCQIMSFGHANFYIISAISAIGSLYSTRKGFFD